MQIEVKNQQGEATQNVDLNDAVFNVPMNRTLVHQAMVIYQGNKRQGTHDTKTRAEVSGGGRKPWIQKHTGRARQGSTRSPQWRHGGVVFGPHPRSYRRTLPRRMRRMALRCVLSDKVRQNRLVCLDAMDTMDGKTKSMAQLLQNLSVTGSALVVTKDPDQNVVLGAHNLKKIWTLPVNLLNAEELLSRDTVIMTLEAAQWASENLSLEPHGRRGGNRTGLNAEAAAPGAVADAAPSPSEEASEAPAPRRRSRAAAAATEGGEEAAPPTPRRRRTTASAPEDTAAEESSEAERPDAGAVEAAADVEAGTEDSGTEGLGTEESGEEG